MVEIFHRIIFLKVKSETVSRPSIFAFFCNFIFLVIPAVIVGVSNLRWTRTETIRIDVINTSISPNYFVLLGSLYDTTERLYFTKCLTFGTDYCTTRQQEYTVPKLSGDLSVLSRNEIIVKPLKMAGASKTNSIKLNLRLLVNNGILLQGYKLIFGFEAFLKPRGNLPLKVAGLGIVQGAYTTTASIIETFGDLSLTQSVPLRKGTTEYQKPFFKSSLTRCPTILELSEVIEDYSNRNVSIGLSNMAAFSRGRRTSSNDPISLRVEINIPEAQIARFETTFLCIAKWYFVSYICLMLPLYWIVRRFQQYVFLDKKLFKNIEIVDEGIRN